MAYFRNNKSQNVPCARNTIVNNFLLRGTAGVSRTMSSTALLNSLKLIGELRPPTECTGFVNSCQILTELMIVHDAEMIYVSECWGSSNNA